MADSQLAKIASLTDAKQKTDQYKAFVVEAVGKADVASLKAAIDHRTLL